ncbi:tetratricopeptide repeat protein [Jeotgalibacillus proteolyticus]|uniref:Tetratrico peptide repeat group 5 domain-containing protein n=1 Tax=Jeotgalibacillus proteolyticus TaxID=2082395 RepID=A0A2S5GBF2_9BACL|nr:tetratricopeptide repeat protein [Jeotgalibacillus proteolyticus]PPA70352.1 hypothetical protein C4B60_12295 [Jeotgalibacillus proteolyticus]
MVSKLNEAIELRRNGDLEKSNQYLLDLCKEYPDDPIVFYQCAWSFDVLGKETEAVPYYEKAIDSGLSGNDLEGAYIGLGSTYRVLGEYEKSREVFLKGLGAFPENQALRVFYAMTLYNVNDHQQAMEILLTSLLETTTDPQVLNYSKAISFYKDKLDRVWS